MSTVRTLTVEDVLAAIARHLAARHVCVLATSVHDVPWAATCFYVPRGLDLFVCQGRRARTLANMRANRRLGFAVDDRVAQAWLQGSGVAEPSTPDDEPWARRALQDTAPEFTRHFTNPEHPLLLIRADELTLVDRPNGIQPRRHLMLKEGEWTFVDGEG